MAIIVTQQFASQHNGYTSGVNEFFARETISGEWACDENSDEEFKILFEGTNFQKRTLTPADFPGSEIE